MLNIKETYLSTNRLGNNANDQEWEIVSRWLETGSLNSQEEIQVCYNNMEKNKKWYYHMNRHKDVSDEWVLSILFFGLVYVPFMRDIGIKIIEMLNQYVTLNEITLFVLQRSVGFMLVIGASIATERILRNIILDKQIRNLNKALEMSLGIKKQNKFFSRMMGLNLFHKSKSYTQQNTTFFSK